MKLPSPLVIATGNPGKLREIRAILAGQAPPDITGLPDYPEYQPPEETAPDYQGNAVLKVLHAAHTLGMAALADDSGLEVDTLGGAPGPRSARYAGEGALDHANNLKLLAELEGRMPAAARYRCVVALAWPDGKFVTAEGTCEGVIVSEARGAGGFGYDPYFRLPDGRGMAEIPAEEKNRISHRAAALFSLLESL